MLDTRYWILDPPSPSGFTRWQQQDLQMTFICVICVICGFSVGGWEDRASSIQNRGSGGQAGMGYPRSMGKAEWGIEPEFFGPRHAHREGRITDRLQRLVTKPGLHLECAAGVGSLSLTLARAEHKVVSVDLSLRSLRVLAARAASAACSDRVLPVVADITALPFENDFFASATSAETLEHVPGHDDAVSELARVLEPGGWLVGTVPAGPQQWSDWDEWAGHLRRYSGDDMKEILAGAGLEPETVVWGWPMLRLYDDLFLKRVNRRRLQHDGAVGSDPALSTVSALGRRRWLVAVVRSVFAIDRLFDGVPWGVGLLFAARKS
jgi:SAM-dependent methyltransferase